MSSIARQLWPVLLTGGLLTVPPGAVAQSLSVTAQRGESTLRWIIPPARIPSICGEDLFAVESVHAGPKATCLRREGAAGRMVIVREYKLPPDLGLYRLIRGLAPADPTAVLWAAPHIKRFHPVTLSTTTISTLTQPTPWNGAPMRLFDRNGDGQLEVLVADDRNSHVRDLATGALLTTYLETPFAFSLERLLFGRLDADPAAELVHFPSGQGIEVYDGMSMQLDQSLSTGWTVDFPAHVLDLESDGRDEVAYVALGTVNVVDFTQAPPVQRTLTVPQVNIEAAVVLQWSGDARPELAVVSADRAAVVDPRTGAVLENWPAVPFGDVLRDLQVVDLDGDGREDLLWNIDQRLIYWRNGAQPVYLQNETARVDALDAPRAAGQPLRTVEFYYGFPGGGETGSAMVDRFATGLERQEMRLVNLPIGAPAVYGDLHPGAGRELVSHGYQRFDLRNAQGTLLWSVPLLTGGSEIELLAASPRPCNTTPCPTLLAAEFLLGGGPQGGSRLVLFDGHTGDRLWSTPLDGRENPSYTAVAFLDINGDQHPDLLSATWIERQITARDGQTRQILWQRQLEDGFLPADLKVSLDTPTQLVLLSKGSLEARLELLNPATGETKRWRNAPVAVTGIRPLRLANGLPGWLLLGDAAAVHVVDGNLRGGIRSLATPDIVEASAFLPGVAYLATEHTVTRIDVPFDTLLIDDFETESP